jgi:hypothetical protein
MFDYPRRFTGVLSVGVFAGLCYQCSAHPASGIVVGPQGEIYFADAARGVFKITSDRKLLRISDHNEHWMVIDPTGRFTRGTSLVLSSPHIYRATADGERPTILLSSGVPIAINESGDLFYAPYTRGGPLEIIKRGRNQQLVLARIERGADGAALHWINGISSASDGTVYFTENAAVRKVSSGGQVSTIVSELTRDNVPPVPGIRPALGPYLRGLSIDGSKNIWVAATGNCSVLKISPTGKVTSILRTESPWSPTGVAVAGEDIYVLEYLHTATDNREDWLPRVIKRSADGRLQTIATIDKER